MITDPPPGSGDRHLTRGDLVRLMSEARAKGLARQARKTRPVDARPATPGEVVVTIITGEGRETCSRPAEEGDWVVRNRCPETGNEEYLVSARVFAERYTAARGPADAAGWREACPRGKAVPFFIVQPEHGEFTFEAPWGERMTARPGDAIVQDPDDPGDIYRVAAASFRCTYEVVG